VLRVDQVLDNLFKAVDATVGLQHTLVILSSDHGVSPMPEVTRKQGKDASREGAADIACVQNVGKTAEQHFSAPGLFFGDFYLDQELIKTKGISRADVDQYVKTALERCPHVEKVWTTSELTSSVDGNNEVARRYRNSFYPQRSPDYFVQYRSNYLRHTRTGTMHGTPYEYDTHVPLLIMHPELSPTVINDTVSTVDLAPTVADLLGIVIPGQVDGKSLVDKISSVTH
jgi:arylsulfatase A-like enzyme